LHSPGVGATASARDASRSTCRRHTMKMDTVWRTLLLVALLALLALPAALAAL